MNCPSCGGEYADWAQRCPYCGTVNEAADERLYLEHLEQIRQKLDTVDEEAEKVYRKNLGASVGKIGRIALIVCAAVALIAALSVVLSSVSARRAEEKTMRRIEWEQAEFQALDAWYASGDFDSIIEEDERLLLEDSEFGLYNWPHYSFIFDYYVPYKDLSSILGNWGEYRQDVYTVADALYCAALLKHGITPEAIKLLSEDEAAAGREYALIADELFLGRLGWTEEETAAFTAEASKGGYISWKVCDVKAGKLVKEGRT